MAIHECSFEAPRDGSRLEDPHVMARIHPAIPPSRCEHGRSGCRQLTSSSSSRRGGRPHASPQRRIAAMGGPGAWRGSPRPTPLPLRVASEGNAKRCVVERQLQASSARADRRAGRAGRVFLFFFYLLLSSPVLAVPSSPAFSQHTRRRDDAWSEPGCVDASALPPSLSQSSGLQLNGLSHGQDPPDAAPVAAPVAASSTRSTPRATPGPCPSSS